MPVLTGTLSVRTVFEKRRVLYRYGNTRIHLDLVAGLGAFVELETVLAGDGQTSDGRAESEAAASEHRRAIALLGLDGLLPIAGSYCDLIQGRNDRPPLEG